MLGLRTQETNKFILFFELVQEKAKEKESVFFLDSGDGNEFRNRDDGRRKPSRMACTSFKS